MLAELDQWWQMVDTRRAGNYTRNPGLGLEQSIRYLTDRLDAATVTPEALGLPALPVLRALPAMMAIR